MISILTLTYERHTILEEAIESYLRQDFKGESEMIVINDSRSDYIYDHDNIRIINIKDRFQSVGKKLEFGFSQCKYDYIYRLDDDDLLAPWALTNTWEDISKNPNYEIYRSDAHYFFENNIYIKKAWNVNTGNVYTKKYLSRIQLPNKSLGEDFDITFSNQAKIYESNRDEKSMIYRWGMNTYHVSGMGDIGNEAINQQTDRIVRVEPNYSNKMRNSGIELHPHFNHDYFHAIL